MTKRATTVQPAIKSGNRVAPLLRVRDLKTHFTAQGGLLSRETNPIKAVDGVSLDICYGQTLGIVGESGCGKTTLAKTILRLIPATTGGVLFDGCDLLGLDRKQLRAVRKHLQIVFQDPAGSLNPRMTIGATIGEPIIIHKIARGKELNRRVAELLERVGLSPAHMNRYPHEFSGGQRQRIGIARALATDPKLIVCDEPVSALDVSVQSQILNLLADLQQEFNLSYLIIAHDLAVVRHFCDNVAVMYLGKIVESGPAQDIYANPKHPYTQALLASVPIPDPKLRNRPTILAGEVPNPSDPPAGCTFHPRCPIATRHCAIEIPTLERKIDLPENHVVACHHTDQSKAASTNTGTIHTSE